MFAWLKPKPEPQQEPKPPADLQIEDGKLLNLGDGPASGVVIVVDGHDVATLDLLPSGHQWDRPIEPGAAVRWTNDDGKQCESQ